MAARTASRAACPCVVSHNATRELRPPPRGGFIALHRSRCLCLIRRCMPPVRAAVPTGIGSIRNHERGPSMNRFFPSFLGFLVLVSAGSAAAEPFELLTGIDALHYPGSARLVTAMPGPSFPNYFYDGDRLAGTSDTGPIVQFQGIGTPRYQPNYQGALSFFFRRGTIPAGPNVIALMGIDFLGGPLLDLDGALSNGVRRFTPIANTSPVEIPGSRSGLDLTLDTAGGAIAINNFDATGTNEGGPNVQAEIATTLVTIAGTNPTGGNDGKTNPSFDIRSGTLTPHASLPNVYRISNLQVELWYDSIDPNSASASTLGTFQHFCTLRGWLVQRNPQTGQFPMLTGQGLGSTLWPAIDTTHVGQVFSTAHGLAGGTAMIRDGAYPGDVYSSTPNGFLLSGGDIGQYFDTVVVPHVSANSNAFVYLESIGFGINNSADPIFGDTNGYDLVVVAQR